MHVGYFSIQVISECVLYVNSYTTLTYDSAVCTEVKYRTHLTRMVFMTANRILFVMCQSAN